MFDFGNANDKQKEAIRTTEGPVHIIAGPGTGKTFTLVQRTLYLIQERGVAPENIMIVTFTKKAAKEIITRITSELLKRDIYVNINEMYIGTFHEICLRLLKEHLEYTRLKRNYRMIEEFEQKYVVARNIETFNEIPNITKVLTEIIKYPKKNYLSWEHAQDICNYVNKLSEELVDPDELLQDEDEKIVAIGEMLKCYQGILLKKNYVDFSSMQTEAYWLLKNHEDVLKEVQSKIKYIMVDEYQDTNYIQEQIIFLLAGEKKNICVVGDDDQGLYRFRGATIRNILEFPKKFPKGKCETIRLEENYRSGKGIIDFYNKWMQTTGGSNFQFNWGEFRLDKTIEATDKNAPAKKSPEVLRISGNNDLVEWKKKILNFIKNLKEKGKITDYNQIAFLFKSVKSYEAIKLSAFLEQNGINVYSPRSAEFFDRDEIKMALGCMMLLFPKYLHKLKDGKYWYLEYKYKEYCTNCKKMASEFIKKPENAGLSRWIDSYSKAHSDLKKDTDYSYSGLVYELFQFEPFSGIIGTSLDKGVFDTRPLRNLAKFSRIINQFDYLYLGGVNIIKKDRIEGYTDKLFNTYLRYHKYSGVDEYEDDREYAPSGCVSFLTIHQSKGMEFPIVFVGSLDNEPSDQKGVVTDLIEKIQEKYFKRPAFEPKDDTKYFDFWRLYYTAFSRAQNLLILTCNEKDELVKIDNRDIRKKVPSTYFEGIYRELESEDSKTFDLSEFQFETVKDVNIKPVFSFTSHISVYDVCARQYKFFRELGFSPVRTGEMLFGILVHETIEDVHRAAMRNEESTITKENVTSWFYTNYAILSKMEQTNLEEKAKRAALKQVLRYVDNQKGDWSVIKQAEVDVSLIKDDYIIGGTIDLIRGEGDTVEIVDFKTGKKPDLNDVSKSHYLERYRRQLHVYAHLVEERTGQKVSKMHLYYTGDESTDPKVSFSYDKKDVNETITEFDKTVHKIMDKDFSRCTEDKEVCYNCDFRYYCGKVEKR